MFLDYFRADPFFLLKFDRRQEEVLKKPQLIFVKIVEEKNDLGIFKSSVTEPLADVSPIVYLQHEHYHCCDKGVSVYIGQELYG